MRLYPPAWITDRVAIEDDVYGGINIRKGDVVNTYIYGAHNDPKRWQNPHEFIPNRFAEDRKNEIASFSYFPFGGGPRLCIGQQFALIEMQLIAYHLYKRFEFELIPDQIIEMEPLVTLRPKYGIKMKVNPRNSDVIAG
jgi:cytochrome P450